MTFKEIVICTKSAFTFDYNSLITCTIAYSMDFVVKRDLIHTREFHSMTTQ